MASAPYERRSRENPRLHPRRGSQRAQGLVDGFELVFPADDASAWQQWARDRRVYRGSMQLLEDLATLDDAALHGALKQTAGKANTLTAQLLAQLGELEARGIYRAGLRLAVHVLRP